MRTSIKTIDPMAKEPLQLAGGGLIYRLTAPANDGGYNVDEINVTMWGGSRNPDARAEGSRRVLACMDACAGIKTLDLEAMRGTSILAKANASFDALCRQRDELLVALDSAKKSLEWIKLHVSVASAEVLEGYVRGAATDIAAAIASAKGGAA